MRAHSLTVTASDSPRVGRVLLAALAALALLSATALAGTAQGAESSCANVKEPQRKQEEQLRAESRSLQLPQCRVYELVSPVDTADSGMFYFLGAAPDGEAASFYSAGVFAGLQSDQAFNEYIARRGSEGWQTSGVAIPAALGATTSGVVTSYDLTKQLVRTLFLTGEKADTCGMLLSGDLLAAPALSYVELSDYPNRGEKLSNESCISTEGASPNFTDVLFGTGRSALYEVSGVGGPTEAVRTASIVEGNTIIASAGNGRANGGTLFHAISNDGAVVFFTPGEGAGFTGESYARVNGKTTLALGGLFQGASEDGSKVFLRGSAGLELVMDKINREPGHEAVKTVPISGASFGFYLRSSDDGSHVYFLSTGKLSGANVEGYSPEENQYNLYVYEPDPEHPGGYRTVFIAQALPGFSSEGNVEAQVNGCPSSELKEVEEAGCEGGRFFVFATTAKITPDDTGSAQQVFEYDAATGHLARVSTGEDGYANNGNGNALGASIAAPDFGATDSKIETDLFEDSTRAVSDDGSTVVFSSSGALSPRAVNDLQPQPGPVDVYESHEGRVSLISTGHSSTSDRQPTIAPSGRDVFFTSTEDILPQKSDGLKGVFDARIEGGFPAAPVPAGGCNGDACQGPPSVPNLLGAPASETFSGLGNPAPVAPTPAVKSKAKPKPKKCKKGYVKKKGRCVKRPKAKKAGNDRRIKS
jgi:hypothetical protein